jgi:hypothetical protein
MSESDWMQDADVIRARTEFDARRLEWTRIAPADLRLPDRPTPAQEAAHDRMHLADCAYTLARDSALERYPRLISEDLPAALSGGPEIATT